MILLVQPVLHLFPQHLEWQLQKIINNNNNVIAVIGDGAMSAGMMASDEQAVSIKINSFK